MSRKKDWRDFGEADDLNQAVELSMIVTL